VNTGYNQRGKLQVRQKLLKSLARYWQLYLLLVPPIIYLFIFKYIPMYGLQIAFKDFNMRLGYFGSPWAGLKHFRNFFKSHYFTRLIGNTVGISFYSIVAGFLPPILLAIALNECRSRFYKKFVQLVTYLPYFLSTVIIVGIITQMLSLHGIVNVFLKTIGIEPISFLGKSNLFKSIYVWSGVWQATGYNAILYLAALAGINPELYEAAIIDGASIWKRIWYIDIPGILPTAIILLILATAGVLNVGFEKVYLLQNPLNLKTSDVISTYVYRVGLLDMNYSFSTAVGFFQSVVSLIFITTVNKIAKNVGETSLW
jgi:putative aldouronate transport system permease protein